MKNQKTLWLSLAVAFVSFSLLAQDQKLQMTLQSSCKQLNDQGKLVKQSMNSKTIINNCADDNAIAPTNRPPLVLVYRVGSGNPRLDTIEVVNKTNGVVLCTVASFSGGISITNADGTQIERHAFVYARDNLSDQIGSAVITEKIPSGNVDKRKIQGKIQFGSPADATTAAEVCSGNFSTSKPFITP